MFKIVLFDLDGTLIDSSDDICDCVNYAMRNHGRDELAKKDIMCHVGVGAAYLIENVLQVNDQSFVKEVLKTFLEHYAQNSIVKTKIYEGVSELLNNITLRVGVITNKPISVGEQVLRRLDLSDRFDWKVYGDTYAVLKPDPCALNHIVAEANVLKDEVLYVGDTGIDLKFAQNAGVKSCLFKSGFGAISTYPEVKADFEIKAFKELVSIIS